ncbi:hypothetical protein LTR62_007824 [Meristemomyces frigidus]|uniref:Xaa-Pro dipeptidyl-peptidase C-terminal domain-containing protein n=1 Tax=Meristemomyces frigidus TaxID=1508187 RepID=A0AAN7TAA7_9PEZI|nr:hypothetical protein LTR62_007824 [Meristemomyces frigidus]
MPNQNRDISAVDKDSYPYIFEQNVTVPIKTYDKGLVRVNVYRPKIDSPVPVLITCGPYGKDVHYARFNPGSYAEVNPKHKGDHAAWETPFPTFWTTHGYAIVRADERGLGQSPGILNSLSRSSWEGYFDVVEWAAEQSWSSGKVGLIGISYYAMGQWRVAALQPKGLAAIVPWEGSSDNYIEAFRHGGIASNKFIEYWWNRQVITNQYGRPGRAAAEWGPDTIEGDLSEEELATNRRTQLDDILSNRFRDDSYFAQEAFDLADVKAPLLSVANWGGLALHLRGNVLGYVGAGSELKYLRTIVGRHDLPFYQDQEVEVQKSFLDAFLKGEDRLGWSEKGKLPPVDIVLRKGNPGFNNAAAELAAFPRRTENEWPIARTQYTKFYLTPDHGLDMEVPSPSDEVVSYRALGNSNDQQFVRFTTAPFEAEIEITGHSVAHLNMSCTTASGAGPPSDIDVFVSLRHFDSEGKEIFYTGTIGDPVPVIKGWLRISLRKVEEDHPKHSEYLPRREYRRSEVQEVKAGEIYAFDVELWPTTVTVDKGSLLVFEVSGGDTQGTGLFDHDHPKDRQAITTTSHAVPDEVFAGTNSIHFSDGHHNYVMLPVIPPK